MKKTACLILFFLLFSRLSISQSNYSDTLNINNVGIILNSTGLLSKCEINPGSGQMTMYAGNLWLGGVDQNGQIKFAGEKYYPGDFFYGPPSIGFSSGNQSGYNNVWKITKQEIEDFIQWHQCLTTPLCTSNPSYIIPQSILNWPAHGDPSQGQSYYLAPFVDVNNNGVYETFAGDYPCIKGDMAIFTIFNDVGTHNSSYGSSIGVEVMAMHYAFASDPSNSGHEDAFQNTFFSEYSLCNRSDTTLNNFHVGFWEEMDIGCIDDDFSGCDISRSLAYTYNALPIDDPNYGSGICSVPFGANPPAQGICFLKGLKMDNDGIDNPLTSDIPLALSLNGIPYEALGCGYGDGIVDNEHRGMSRFFSFDRSLPQNTFGIPSVYPDYYDYLSGKWIDGSNLVYGGLGHHSSTGATANFSNYQYPGESDPLFWSTGGISSSPSNWSEVTNINSPGDRMILTVCGPITFESGEHYEFTIAHITGRDTTGTNTGLETLFNHTDLISNYYKCETSVFDNECRHFTAAIEQFHYLPNIKLYPNPTSGQVQILNPNDLKLASITVKDELGRVVMTLNNLTGSQISFELTEAPGVYFVTVTNDQSQGKTFKVIKK